ncbi:A/G-specific adenine glycosylase [Streptococcus oralis]|uniref:A/G-specific adenine glycosylase n=1 Tax=Streptococcus oralis TaxID=1303 RepID=A0A139QT49_STROR|nr:A/G-specific adenine glycosylase [Streptococcus oralis]
MTESKQFSDREIRWVSPQEFADYPLAKPQQKIWQVYKTVLGDGDWN